ncbi:unnamed protein product [Chironomus riparius]|uniref:Uncharacterized protein n=1 Tax=Chironomus riparius TaxID=315576 RepID=A0A9P0NRG4_9DIPT|nr:unnamed protein product [Chironomus riparius]
MDYKTKDNKNYKLDADDRPAIVISRKAYDLILKNDKWYKALKRQRTSFEETNELDKSIAMQFIEHHNATFTTTKKEKSKNIKIKKINFKINLHLNQEEFKNYLFREGFINEEKMQFLLNVVNGLKLCRLELVENQYLKDI